MSLDRHDRLAFTKDEVDRICDAYDAQLAELLQACRDALACLHAWKSDLEKYREYAPLLNHLGEAITKAEEQRK